MTDHTAPAERAVALPEHSPSCGPATGLDDEKLVTVFAEVHARAAMYGTKVLHDRWRECRDELLRRLADRARAPQPVALPDRDAFEAWVLANHVSLNGVSIIKRDGADGYSNRLVGSEWRCWQAARAAPSEDAVDAARYREARNFIGATRFAGARMYTIDMQPPANVFQGSVAQHFDATCDAAIAARKP